jgi:hypothetical protein
MDKRESHFRWLEWPRSKAGSNGGDREVGTCLPAAGPREAGPEGSWSKL